MNIEEWKEGFEKAMIVKINLIDSAKELMVLDIGIFPWHSSVELSLFYHSDSSDADVKDIASWPFYNFSEQAESKWPEIELLATEMASHFNKSPDSELFFEASAEVAKSSAISTALQQKHLAPDFTISLVHPDDPSKSYM